MSPSLGQILQRARLARGITLEDAERVTRIPRKYLEALEQEHFSILPAPVYARGFLRSYAGYLGLDPAELLPFFPVGHVEEPKLEPLPQVKQRKPWTMSGFVALAAVAILILAVLALYGLGRDGGQSGLLSRSQPLASSGQTQETSPAAAGRGEVAIPNLVGFQVADATAQLDGLNLGYVIIAVQAGDVPEGQVVAQDPPPGATLTPGQTVSLTVSR